MVGKYLRPYISRMILQLFIKLSGTVVELLLPSMLSRILDVYAASGDIRGVWMLGGLMLLCAVLAWIGNCTANKMATGISRDFIIHLRKDLFDRVLTLSASQRDSISEASLISRLTSDSYNVHNMVDRMQRLGIRAPIMLLGGILVSLTLDPVLTLVLVCTLPLLGITIYYSSKKGVPLFTKVQEGQDKMVRKVQENMAGARVIRALSRTDYEQQSFGEVNDTLANRQRKADLTMAAVSPLTNLVLNTGLAVVVLVGAYRVSIGASLPGAIIAFLSYFTIILNSLLMLSRMFVMWSKGTASAGRIERVLNTPKDLSVLPDLNHRSNVDKAPHISFRNVSFSYNKTTPNVSDISFDLYHGQTLGIIGPTGSGKTTLLALMIREYDADTGEILVDGKPIQSLDSNELHNHLGVVFQNDFLMADSLRNNIQFGRDISENQLSQAIQSAQAEFIHEKEHGLDFELNVKGHNLSGGQQQRVLISRALSGNPSLLLLDDCSSALDYRTDRDLRHALRETYGQTTTVLVAQRVSAVMGADLILVMDRGHIIGRGTHGELMTQCPMYQELCHLQLGGELQ